MRALRLNVELIKIQIDHCFLLLLCHMVFDAHLNGYVDDVLRQVLD